MKKDRVEEEVLEKAEMLGRLWLDSFRLDGVHDEEECLKALSGRKGPEGEDVLALVVRSPEEVLPALRKGALQCGVKEEDLPTVLKDAYSCVWDYYWMAFYECAMQASGLSNYLTDQSLLPAFKAGIGHIINMGGLMVGVMLPEAHLDERKTLHREDGPAIVWGEEKHYYWHGTKVPAEWIEDKESIDVVELLQWSNTEERRAGCEIVGWARVLEKLNAEVVDENKDPEIGTLLRVNLPDAENSYFLKVRCGTGRTFALPVPDDMRTALQANAWTYGLDPEEYAELEVRT